MADYWSPESTCAKLKPARADDRPREFKSNTGNAAVDGYTVGARRLMGDIPGEMVSRDEADRREAWDKEMAGMGIGPASDYDD